MTNLDSPPRQAWWFPMIAVLGLSGCTAPGIQQPSKYLNASAAYHSSSTLAGSFRGCIYQYYLQGVGIQRAVEMCTAQLNGQTVGADTSGNSSLVTQTFSPDTTDAPTLTAACATGTDPRRSHGLADYDIPPGGVRNFYVPKSDGWGGYSWGGEKGKVYKDPGTGEQYQNKGLSYEEAKAAKEAAIKEAEEKGREFREAEKRADDANAAAKANPTPENKKAAQRANEEAKAKAREEELAREKARADPNKGPVPASRIAGDLPSACQSAMEGARQFIAECNRTNWKRGDCQIFAARLNHCPDPTLAYIDPDSGSASCGSMGEVRPQDVADAYRAECEKLVRYGPGGVNPCDVGTPEGGFMRARPEDICANPTAYTTDDACVLTLEVRSPPGVHTPTVDELIVWGIRKFGGPVIVLPSTGPGGGPHPPY